MQTLIFEKSSLAPLPNRVGWAFFTAFFWILWVYLWMPLITLAIWALGFDAYGDYFQKNIKNHLDEMKHLFILYTSVIVVMGGSLLVWAKIEFMRFRNVRRRMCPVPAAVKELADFAQVATETMARLSSVRRMVVHHDDHGKFLYAEILSHENSSVEYDELESAVLSGKVDVGGNVLSADDYLYTEAGEIHALVALEDSVIFASTERAIRVIEIQAAA